MTKQEARVGQKARFVGKDKVFHEGEREGKVGTIVADADMNEAPDASDWGEGDCYWRLGGRDFVTSLADLEVVA